MKSEARCTRASTTLQCFIRRLLAGAETKRHRELKRRWASRRWCGGRRPRRRPAKMPSRAKAKRENARRALIRPVGLARS